MDECKVGRTPWSAADAHVGLLLVFVMLEEASPEGPARTRGSAPPDATLLPLRDRLRSVAAFDYQLSQQFHHRIQRQNIGYRNRRSPAVVFHVKIGALVGKKLDHFGNLRLCGVSDGACNRSMHRIV